MQRVARDMSCFSWFPRAGQPMATGCSQPMLPEKGSTRKRKASTATVAEIWSPAAASGPEMIIPAHLPKHPVPINELDLAMLHFPGVTAHNFYHGKLDASKLQDAFARVLENNPVLAGRLRSTRRSASGEPEMVEVHFDGATGVPFHTQQMDPVLEFELQGFSSEQSVAKNPLEWEQMVEKLGIMNTGPGSSQIDAEDRPLCTVSHIIGKSTSVLTLSVSHLIGDGSTYFQLLRAWDQEVENPGSTRPMGGRDSVMDVDRELKSKYTEWEQDALKDFYPAKYQDGYLKRNLQKYSMVSTSLSDSVLRKIKDEQQAKIGEGVVFSTQDSLIAWLGKHLSAKWFAFTVDLRGRAESLPADTMGNAFQTWYGVPEAGPDGFSALDVRKAIAAKGANIRPALEHALQTGIDSSIDVNSWLKLQYQPRFGGEPWKQVRALGRGSLPFLFRMNYHVIYQIEKGQYIMFNFGLLKEQAADLAEKWSSLGATSTVTSGQDLLRVLETASRRTTTRSARAKAWPRVCRKDARIGESAV